MSTVDWPKNICTVIFFSGCDYKCPYCQNSEIISPAEEHRKDLKEVKKEIRKNADFIDAVLFSGGEATLQRHALIELGMFAKKLGLKIGLETNGTRPVVIEYLIAEGLLDFIALDMKAPLTDPALVERTTRSKTFFKTTEETIASLNQTLSVLKRYESRLEIEFRTTIVPRLIYRKGDVLSIARDISASGIDARWSLQQYRGDLGTVLDPMYRNLDYPKRAFIEQLREICLKAYPNLRIDVKAV